MSIKSFMREVGPVIKSGFNTATDVKTVIYSEGTITDASALKSMRKVTVAIDVSVMAIGVASAIALGKGFWMGLLCYTVVTNVVSIAGYKSGAYKAIYNKALGTCAPESFIINH